MSIGGIAMNYFNHKYEGFKLNNLESLEGEIWKPIPLWENVYEASNMGRIKRIKASSGTRPGHINRLRQSTNGYLNILLSDGSRKWVGSVHRIIATTFIGLPPFPTYQVHHINNNKTDNRVENLQWVTPKENSSFRKPPKRDTNIIAKLTSSQVTRLKELSPFLNRNELSKLFSISTRQVRRLQLV
jgi:hypothetical protein